MANFLGTDSFGFLSGGGAPTPPTPDNAVIILGSGTCSSVRKLVSNDSSGAYSGAFGGECNISSAPYSVIGGGKINTVSGSGCYSFIGGGLDNTTSGGGTFIGRDRAIFQAVVHLP
jgi:hypothetical protein